MSELQQTWIAILGEHALPLAAFVGLSLALAFVLRLANVFLSVYEDPRIAAVAEMLPRNNCGACGFAGCRPFAEALVAGKAQPAGCTVSAPAERERIADYLNVAVGEQEKRVARLACAGGSNAALLRARYQGLKSCMAAEQVAGGGKGCAWGCLGLGDCEASCDFEAITMQADALPRVDPALCTACGDCVVACPRDLFSLQPVSHRLQVRCMSELAGDPVLEECAVGCTACEKCVHDAPSGLLEMRNNLPVVDYSRNDLATRDIIERCPTGAIVWYVNDGDAVIGREAPPVHRRAPLPIRPLR